MAKQVIVLDVNQNIGGMIGVRTVLWLPSSSPVPKPSLTSSAWVNASAPEIAALANGSIVEEVYTFQFALGLPVATVEARLVEFFASRLAYLNAQTPAPGSFFGVYYDGAWHLAGQ